MRTATSLKLSTWVGIIFIVNFGFSVVSAQEIETINFSPDRDFLDKWQVGHDQQFDGGVITEWVPMGETVESWSKMFTSLNLAKTDLPSAEDSMKLLRDRMAKRCPNVIWNVIEKNKQDILFEWRIENCSGNADQHNLQKILDGKWNQFHLMYVRKVKELPADEREQWLKGLRTSKILVRKE